MKGDEPHLLHYAPDNGHGRPARSAVCGKRPGSMGCWTDDLRRVAELSTCFECKRLALRHFPTRKG